MLCKMTKYKINSIKLLKPYSDNRLSYSKPNFNSLNCLNFFFKIDKFSENHL